MTILNGMGDELREAINTEVALDLIPKLGQLDERRREFLSIGDFDDRDKIRDPAGVNAAESEIRGLMLPFGGSCEIGGVTYSVPDQPSWATTQSLFDELAAKLAR